METPLIRPGLVSAADSLPRVFAFFFNSAQANSVIQLLTAIGVPHGRLSAPPPEQIEGGQGMIRSIPCPSDKILHRVEDICGQQETRIHRRRA